MTTATNTYVLGDTASERRRLQQQSDLIGGFTRHVFEQAGIAPGMKVLDVGSGAGDVALLLANMVGPAGRIVGIDRNPAILSTAKQRITAAGHANVEFVAGDISDTDVALDTDFDAAVGRLVLMYNPDTTAAGRSRLAEATRRSGSSCRSCLLARDFHDRSCSSTRTWAAVPSSAVPSSQQPRYAVCCR
jgi:ubiquinone/menaquinone biosynthesis C-methylase UbiE